MKLVTAIVRPEKVMDVIKALEESGYFAFSKWAISGRGKEKGIQVGDVLYQEMAKSMLYITVEDKEKDEVVDIIVNSAKSGAYGCILVGENKFEGMVVNSRIWLQRLINAMTAARNASLASKQQTPTLPLSSCLRIPAFLHYRQISFYHP